MIHTAHSSVSSSRHHERPNMASHEAVLGLFVVCALCCILSLIASIHARTERKGAKQGSIASPERTRAFLVASLQFSSVQ